MAEQLGLFQQFESRTSDHLLIQELGLVHAPETSKAQLALRKIRKEALSEEDHGCPKEDASAAYTQAAQNTSEVSLNRFDESSRSSRGLYNPEYLFAVYVLKACPFRLLVFPTAPAMRAFEEKFLVLVLWHLTGGAPNALIGLGGLGRPPRGGRPGPAEGAELDNLRRVG